jgi:hypothetical protein
MTGAITAGQEFSNLKDFKRAVISWAVKDGFHTKTFKSDPQRMTFKCKSDPLCSFRVSAWWRAGLNKAVVKSVNPEHTACIGATAPRNQTVNKQEFLQEAIATYMPVTRATKPADVQRFLQHQAGTVKNQKISYSAARRALQKMR